MSNKIHPATGLNDAFSGVTNTSSASVPAKVLPQSHGLPHGLPQDAIKNSKKFFARFKTELLRSSGKSATPDNRNPLLTKIGTPVIRGNTALKTIREPAPEELIAEVESFRQSSLAKNDSGTLVDWDAFAAQHKHLAPEVQALRQKLEGIDARMNGAINELRLTVYEDIRNASQRLTPQYEKKAKDDTQKTMQERFSIGAARKNMRAARIAVREQSVKTEAAKDMQAAIGRFKQRVRDDFEPERPKDVREACVELLGRHFGAAAPSGPLAELVNRISPEAIGKFRQMQALENTARPSGETARPSSAKGPPPAPPPRWSKRYQMAASAAPQTAPIPQPARQPSDKGPPPVPPPRWSKRHQMAASAAAQTAPTPQTARQPSDKGPPPVPPPRWSKR